MNEDDKFYSLIHKVEEFHTSNLMEIVNLSNGEQRSIQEVKWCCPKMGWRKLNMDGAVYLGSQQAASRGVLYDPTGTYIGGLMHRIGSYIVIDMEL